VPEAEWDEQQQGWMLALAMWDDTRCTGCGGDLRLTTTHEWWRAEVVAQCHRCASISTKQEKYATDYPGLMHTFRWSAKRR
jgi:hypothetical protein